MRFAFLSSRVRVHPLCVLGLCAMGFVARPAWGEPVDAATRSAARSLGYSGVAAFQAGNFALANEKLEKAYQALHAPSLGLWSARSLVKLGKLVEGAERYLEVTRLEPSGGDLAVQKQAQTEATSELESLTPKIPSVIVDLQGAQPSEVTLTIDSIALSSALVGEKRPVNPGHHKIEAMRASTHTETEVDVSMGEQKHALLTFSAPATGLSPGPTTAHPTLDSSLEPAVGTASGKNPRRTVSYVALGVGGAGLIAGGVAGGLALGKKGQLRDAGCVDVRCPPTEQGRVDSYNSLRTISTVGFIAGGVLAAAGVVLLVTSPKTSGESDVRAAIWVAPQSAGFSGSF